MLTGEPIPVEKPRAKVIGPRSTRGRARDPRRKSRVGHGARADRAGWSPAQRSRAPMQRLADKVSFWFVLAVLGDCAGEFVAWGVFGPKPSWTFAVVNAVAVLIIACLCARLATPMSIMVATGRAAQAGVLSACRSHRAAAHHRYVDRRQTGTLTQGRRLFAGRRPCEFPCRRWCFASQPASTRVVSIRCRRDRCQKPADATCGWRLPTTSSRSPSRRTRRVTAGHWRWAASGDDGIGADFSVLALEAERLRLEGATAMFLAVDVTPRTIAVADPIKDSTPARR